MRPKLPTTLLTTHPRLPPPPFLLLLLHTQPSPRLPHPYHNNRPLTTSPPLGRKGGKQDSKRTVALNAEKTTGIDPFDFADYDAAITRAHEGLKSELGKIRAGGLGVERVEGVRVVFGKAKGEGKGEKGKGAVRVGDVASVVARGRNIAVLVGEKDHLKPILSSLQSPPSNLSPSPSPTDPLTLLIPIPPTTAESRRDARAVADRKGEEALFALREARGAQRKRHRALELGRVVGPDELRRAEREVERRNAEAVAEAKKLVEGCRRGLMGG